MIETSSYYARRDVDESSSSSRIGYNKNNYNKKNMYFQQYGFDMPTLDDSGGGVGGEVINFVNSSEIMARLVKEDALEQPPALQKLMRKSHSYSGTIRPKATIIKQDSLNGRIATSLTADTVPESAKDFESVAYLLENHSSSKGNANKNDETSNGVVFVEESDDQEESLLIPDVTASPTRRSSSKRSYGKSSSLTTSERSSMCYRVHTYITRNWYLNYLLPISILIALMIVAYLTRDYAKRLLFWIETQNPWLIFAIFMLLFVIVSFPVVVGYFVLMITSGYLFGFFKGLLIVILGANIGIALAHVTLRALRHRIPLHRLIKNETGRAILRVISGPRAFRVVLFTRLTPIPFGLQNAIFGVSSINPRTYHTATFIGLLPAQIINVYLGSTLRSMHEVLNSHGTAVTGYISLGIEVICGVGLMFWVVQKARKELSETLLSCSTERKVTDIPV